jgi:hypothetical protein
MLRGVKNTLDPPVCKAPMEDAKGALNRSGGGGADRCKEASRGALREDGDAWWHEVAIASFALAPLAFTRRIPPGLGNDGAG